MKLNFRSLIPLSLVFLSACGRFESEVVSQGTAAPSPEAISALVPTPSPSPEQCFEFNPEISLPENADDPKSYIGHHYNELAMPEGLVFMGGGMLNDQYLWEWVSRPGFDMEFVSQLICRKPDGSPYNVVVDAVMIPKAREDYVRADACSPLPDAGPAIVFGKYDASQTETTLLGVQGWKMFDLDFGQQIDLQTMHFQPLPLDGVECLHMSGLGGS